MPTLLPTLNSMPCVHGLSYLLSWWWTWPTGNLGRDQKEEEERGNSHSAVLLDYCWILSCDAGRSLPPWGGPFYRTLLSRKERSSDCSHPLLLQRWVVLGISQLLAMIQNSFFVFFDTGFTVLQKHFIIKPYPNCPVPCGVNSALPREVSAWAPDLPLNPATLTNSGDMGSSFIAGCLSFLG